jgi:N-acetylglutamate synthase-like GNAT family acetyltransferase
MFFDYTLTSRRRKAPAKCSAEPIVRLATTADLSFILHLQRRFTNEVGFLPTAALEDWIDRRAVVLVEENAEPAGYAVVRPRVNSARWCRPVSQIAVAMDARRRHLGFALLAHVARHAQADLLEAIQCWTATDLEAVDFFKTAGFSIVATRSPQNVRRRSLHLMRASLQDFLPANFFTTPRVAGCRPTRIVGTPAEPLVCGRRNAPHAAAAIS